MNYKNIKVEKRENYAIIEIANNKNNSLDQKTLNEIGDATKNLNKSKEIKCIGLIGGPKFFSPGADIKELEKLDSKKAKKQKLFSKVDDLQKIEKIREVRLKVFLKRDSDLSIPSLYKIFKGSDWQERETFDMYGINFIDHPNPKRLLMPEDWRGWPLRKDYIQPDFYELQDAY